MEESIRIRRAVVLAIALILAGSCTDVHVGIPAAPSDLATGAVIFEHSDFQGQSAHITENISDLSERAGPCKHTTTSCDLNGVCTDDTTYDWADCASSIRVAPGWVATVYVDPGYRGQSHTTTVDVANLELVPGSCDKKGLNDCISSIVVRQQ